MEVFESLLQFLRDLKNDGINFSDFIVDTLVNNSENRQNLNILRAYGLSVQNIESTRVTTIRATCTDHVSSNSFLKAKTIKLMISHQYKLEPDIPVLQCSKTIRSTDSTTKEYH